MKHGLLAVLFVVFGFVFSFKANALDINDNGLSEKAKLEVQKIAIELAEKEAAAKKAEAERAINAEKNKIAAESAALAKKNAEKDAIKEIGRAHV